VLVSGAGGLIGSALIPVLNAAGHGVVRLVRSKPHMAEAKIHWDPQEGRLDRAKLAGIDAVVHLAGENIAGRWTDRKKTDIRESRIAGTRLLAEALAELKDPPRVFACASAIGYYGDRGEELLTEQSPAGSGFLPEVCKEWEAACEPARSKGIRVVNLRFGIVLSEKDGALAKMLTPFKLGAGGRMGSGKQWWSWVTVDDAATTTLFAIENEQPKGPINVVAPYAVTNREFTKTLGRVLHRPTFAPMPAFAARLALGEMADALLLSSARVGPLVLMEGGFKFAHPKLQPALTALLKK
jgi:hypothetical protein